MPRILVLNPNTTASVTDLVARHARDELGTGFECLPATVRFGPNYISSEASYAIAGHAATRSGRTVAPASRRCWRVGRTGFTLASKE